MRKALGRVMRSDAVLMYVNGASQEDAAEAADVSVKTFVKWLKEAAVEPRSRGRPRKPGPEPKEAK